MYFSDIRIQNYKSYRDSRTLELGRGINIIVGKNNVGKTAFLDALSLRFGAVPHRSPRSLPFDTRELKPISTVEFTFTLSKEELLDLLIHAQTRGNSDFRLPLPDQSDPVWKELRLKTYDEAAADRFSEWFLSHDSYTFRVQREAFDRVRREDFDKTAANWLVVDEPYVSPHFERSGKHNESAPKQYGQFRVDPVERCFSFSGHTQVSGGGNRYSDDFILRVASHLHRYIYMFRAERFPFRVVQLGVDRTLSPDARNLAEVLNLLQQNLDQFSKYNKLVREVLPIIKQVGTRKLSDNQGEVVVWTDEEAISRDSLAFSLSECGSGVGQVLSILYVILTSTTPQIILVDEPQGFLHPGAVRKLVEILRQNAESRHQIVIATHSPTVITGANPTTITVINQDGDESVFENVDIRETRHQQKYLRGVGARLADVFGFDRVLWVEGETEEMCFPFIVRELAKKPLMGTAILRVQHPGDFNRKDARNVISIYERLSQLEGGLVPPVVGFVFDRETRSNDEQKDLKRQSRGRIHFTPKRMYENYLLNPSAVAAVANSIVGFSHRKITPQRVQKWIDKNWQDPKYYRPLKVPSKINGWADTVHGARFLEGLFNELSKGKVAFDKTDHSVALTEWIVKNSPDDLYQISKLLAAVLSDIEVD